MRASGYDRVESDWYIEPAWIVDALAEVEEFRGMSDIIREARRKKGWSQRKLASQIGVKPSAVAQWELGQTNPTIANRADISRLLAVPFEQLLPEGRKFAEEVAQDTQLQAIIQQVLRLPVPLRVALLLQVSAIVEQLEARQPAPSGTVHRESHVCDDKQGRGLGAAGIARRSEKTALAAIHAARAGLGQFKAGKHAAGRD